MSMSLRPAAWLLSAFLSVALAACHNGGPEQNAAPVASAGADFSVSPGSTVALDGTGSVDRDGRIASYQWTQVSPASPQVPLTGATTARPTFTAPNVTAPTAFTFNLTVTDDDGATDSDTVIVTVRNQAPHADAGPAQTVNSGTVVTLNGGNSTDSDGTITTYHWQQTAPANPQPALSNANAVTTTFTAPSVNVDTPFNFQLTVTDNAGATSSASVIITVRPAGAGNQPPVANAGADQTVNETAQVTLNGTASTDPDGTIASYQWTQTAPASPQVLISNGTADQASFTAPDVSADTTFTFSLTVTDNLGATSTDSVNVLVQDVPAQQPVITIANASANEGAGTMTFTLTLTPASAQSVTVHYATQDGSATAGQDYTATSATATFAPNATTTTFTVPVLQDTADEADETFQVTLSAPTNATLGNATATGTIVDDDAAPPVSNCVQGSLCAGAAKRSIVPTKNQIDGIPLEDRLGGSQVKQLFHLGGFGFGPFESSKFIDTYSDGAISERSCAPGTDSCISEEPARRAFNCRDGSTTCAEDSDLAEHTNVRAFFLSQPGATPGTTTQIMFVTLDAVGAGNVIIGGVKKAVSDVTGVPQDNVIVGMTHSHAGADLQGLWGGVPQDWVQHRLYTAAAAAALDAKQHAQKATLTYGKGIDSAFNSYRRPKIYQEDDADPTLNILQAKNEAGVVLGNIVQYAAHPTGVGTGAGGDKGRAVHPDYVLGLEDTVEAATGGAATLFYNGPIADSSGSGPTVGNDDYQRVRSRGQCLAQDALSLLDAAQPLCSFAELKRADVSTTTLAPTLTVAHKTAVLPVTNPLFLAGALTESFNRYYDFAQLPLSNFPEPIGSQLVALQPNIPQVAPVASTLVSRITIGGAGSGLEVVTIPGEGTNTFGKYIRGLTSNRNMMLLGLTQNSFGYIIPEEEFNYVDASGDAGFVLPFTGYEEFVSLGPITAGMLRLQGYNPLFGLAQTDPRNLPPSVTACADDPAGRACALSRAVAQIDYIQRSYANSCRQNIVGNAPAELKAQAEAFCGLIDPDTPLHQPCVDAGGPQAVCDALGNGASAPSGDQALIQASLENLIRGCDILDTANCLYPFPNDAFTIDAPAGSPQSVLLGGTGRRVNISRAATPHNSAGKPVDPTEWNRSDGFSPGALITTFVPGLSLEKTFNKPTAQVGLANIGLSLDAASPIQVLAVPKAPELPAPRRALVWSELDANANLLVPAAAPLVGSAQDNGIPFNDQNRPLNDGKAALLIRPGKNLDEGRRYVVVLRSLKDATGAQIAAQPAFAACRDHVASLLPPVQARCAALEANVFPVLAAAGIARDSSLYLAWDFTVISTNSQIGRLRAMRDDAFSTLKTTGAADCTVAHEDGACLAPTFTVDTVTLTPQQGIAKRIEGTITVPSYLLPMDAAPLEDPAISGVINQSCALLPSNAPSQLLDFCATVRETGGIGQGASLPPNRLAYTPAFNPADPEGSLYGNGLPTRTGSMTTRYICQIPAQATPDAPARPSIYGHGLLDSRVAVTYDGVPEVSREFNRMYCAVDFFGFATGDLGNVVSSLVDVSNFQVVPDASQQGMVNFMFLARLLRDPRGFASNAEFQDPRTRRPLFDRSEVTYDGNSQGGILGSVIIAADKDVNRGVLGSLGMNYSTLLTRSSDFDQYAGALYLSYTDPLDRQLLFSMIQMLWDRSENDGYAAHLTDNSAFGGQPKAVKLDPNFGDHQVTKWSAEVMARTMGIPYDAQQTARAAAALNQTKRDPDVAPYLGLQTLDFSDAAQTSGGAMIVWDSKNHGVFADIPPTNNTPPRTGDDPHDNSAKTRSGRCQKAHFLRTGGRLIDITDLEFDPANHVCPAVPSAPPTVAVAQSQPVVTLADALGRFASGIGSAMTALANGDVMGALGAFQSSGGALGGSLLTLAAENLGNAAGLSLPPPSSVAVNSPPPQALLAGAAKGAIQVPVGAPLGGYLRPPVGGEYLPGFEAFAGGDPMPFFQEFLDFIPSQADDGEPLLPVPDELRKLHSPYATYSAPSRGYYDSLIAKAVAMYDGHDYVVLVKTDFIGMLDEVVQGVADEVKRRKGIDIHEGLVMSGTHTHDGPGAIANHSTRYFWLAMDAYQPELYERIVPQLADVVIAALNNLQPARFGYAMGTEDNRDPITGASRQLNSYRRDRLPSYSLAEDDEMRRRIGVLRVDKADGTPLAFVMNYSAHGIAFDVENQYYSGDVLAAAERELEQGFTTPVVAMEIQNTTGDVTPRADGAPVLQRIERFGKLLAPQVRAVYDSVNNFDYAPDLRSVSQRIVLSRQRLGYADGEFPYEWGAPQCNNDADTPFVGTTNGQFGKLPGCIEAPPPDAADLADNGVGENGAFVPQDTRLTAVKIGNALLLAQPGEPLSEYGVRVIKMAQGLGYKKEDTFIWGYSQDHVGYILAPEKADWDMGGVEGTTTFWGWKQGARFIDVSRDLATALRDGTAPPPDEFQIHYTYEDLYKLQPRPQAVPSGQPGRAVSQPHDIKRFEQTQFVWEGGDPVVDTPVVTMELKAGDGTWHAARRANGEPINTYYEMHLKYRYDSDAHIWLVEFEAPKEWAPGSYRFSIVGSAFVSAAAPYTLVSREFKVSPAKTLLISTPVRTGFGDEVEVTLAYKPHPENYRLIDAQVASDIPAPVRHGVVVFSNGSSNAITGAPVIEARNGRLVAVYRAQLAGVVTAEGMDQELNTTPGASAPADPEVAGYGVGVLGALAAFMHDANGVLTTLVQGDVSAAAAQMQAAFTRLAGNLANVLGGDSGSLLALLQNAFGTLQKDPAAVPGQIGSDSGSVLGTDVDPVTGLMRAGSAQRKAEAVVITGSKIPAWTVPAAQGSPYPYPSGATISGALFDPTPIPGQVHDAHNGVMLYPVPGAPMGKPADRIAAYAYRNGAFVEIPVQVDQKFPFFLANASSDFSVYSGTDEELTYEWDQERWQNLDDPAHPGRALYTKGMADPVTGLDDDDEVVFMAQDAGAMAPSGTRPNDPDLDAAETLQQVVLADALNPQYQGYVYLGIKKAARAPKFANQQVYVNYARDANADQWIDRNFFADSDPQKIGTSNTGYGPNRSGTVRPGNDPYFGTCTGNGANRVCNSTDRFPRDGTTVSTDAYQWYASGRWMIRELHVARPGQTLPANHAPGEGVVYGADLIDRWKGRAFQQAPDSNISVVGFEDEQVNWEANGTLLGDRKGPVRAIREVWGADSGTNVTKTETFYRDAVTYRFHVRVHPIPPDGLYTAWDYNRSAMVPAPGEAVPGGRYYTVLRPQGVPIDGSNDDVGQVDSATPINGQCPSADAGGFVPPNPEGHCPAFFDANDSTFNLPLAFDNWEEVSGKGNNGSLVYTFELKGATSLANPAVVPYYRDDACLDDGTGDDPVQRPYPGEAQTDMRVRRGYVAASGGDGNANDAAVNAQFNALPCGNKQGAYGAHGIHYFVTHDSDNAFVYGKPIDEIDGQQWQFVVPTAAPHNLGEPYANIVRVPLAAAVTPAP